MSLLAATAETILLALAGAFTVRQVLLARTVVVEAALTTQGPDSLAATEAAVLNGMQHMARAEAAEAVPAAQRLAPALVVTAAHTAAAEAAAAREAALARTGG